MQPRPTLLAHLAYKLSPQTETVATEALGHILHGSETARKALQTFLESAGADVGRINIVGTEVTGEAGERPDLACMDEDGRERVLIELKFQAGLTGNQPVTYLSRLPDDRASALLFIAPSWRLETLWPQLKARAAAEFAVGGEGAATEVRRLSFGDSRHLILTSWPSFLDRLEKTAEDEQTLSDIRQLRGLADQQDADAFLPLRAEQLSPETPRLILNLDRLVDDVSSKIFATDWAERGRMRKMWDAGPYQYMTFAGLPAWFGVNYWHWRQYEITPLWFGFQGAAWEQEGQILNSLGPMRHQDPPRYFEDEGIIPIRLRTGTEYEVVVDDVVRQLADIGRLLLGTVA